mmetsp:Transcript_64940/g.152785  ORF Transcript_64940/g.152785 Transcript_64940/m.152785 type:complete len:202 (-) Transcript_64940:720-1325(-)
MCCCHMQYAVATVIAVGRNLLPCHIHEFDFQKVFFALLSEFTELFSLFSFCELQSLLLATYIFLILCIDGLGPLLLEGIGLRWVPGLQYGTGLIIAGHIEWKLPMAVLCARITAALQKQLGYSLMPLKTRSMESRSAIASCCLRIAPNGCLPVQKALHYLQVALHGSLRQRGVPTAVLSHGICGLVQQIFHLLQLPIKSKL